MSYWFLIMSLVLSLLEATDRSKDADDTKALAMVSKAARSAIYSAAQKRRLGRRGAAEMARICWRESRCTEIGSHARDVAYAARQMEAAKKRGWIDFVACPSLPRDANQYGTRGPFGLVAAYHASLLGKCSAPSRLDTYVGGADAAAAKIKLCAWCHRCSDRAKAWAGRAAWSKRRLMRRFSNVRRHCGVTRARIWLVSPWAW